MRCYICDYDEKLGNSDYLDFQVPASDPLPIRGNDRRMHPSKGHGKGAGVVTEDRDGRWVCSACRGEGNSAAQDMSFMLDYPEEEDYNGIQVEEGKDDRDKAA